MLDYLDLFAGREISGVWNSYHYFNSVWLRYLLRNGMLDCYDLVHANRLISRPNVHPVVTFTPNQPCFWV